MSQPGGGIFFAVLDLGRRFLQIDAGLFGEHFNAFAIAGVKLPTTLLPFSDYSIATSFQKILVEAIVFLHFH